MASIPLIIILLSLFIIIMAVFSRENADYVVITLIISVIAIFATVYLLPELDGSIDTYPAMFDLFGNQTEARFWTFIHFIEFEPIIFLISMQIIVVLIEKNKIFQWIALKTLHFTKGNHRKFFYLICIISALSASIVADITIAIIFIPLVIRACKILRINATPYLFGISFTVNIGSLYTPFSSSENILISDIFGLNFIWFLRSFTFYVLPVLILTLFVLDMFLLRKNPPPDEERKKILLDIMDPNLVIVNNKKFIVNFSLFVLTIIAFILFPFAYAVAAISALVMTLVNRTRFAETLIKIDWKVIFFFIGLFILMGCMEISGFFVVLGQGAQTIISDNPLIAGITVLILIGILSGFLAQVPTALVFIAILRNLYTFNGELIVPDLILMGFLFGINLGSNFLPQGAACDLMALSLAKKYGISEFNYKSLLKNGSLITVFHIINSIVYMTAYYFITL